MYDDNDSLEPEKDSVAKIISNEPDKINKCD